MKTRRRLLSLMMAGVMLFSTIPVNTLAAGIPRSRMLCEHHPAHTAECGYTEGEEGSPCAHKHRPDCYTLTTKCVHEHKVNDGEADREGSLGYDEGCYPEDSISDSNATPSNAEEREPENCPHVCSEESGCITKELDCQHEHGGDCGYIPATEDGNGSPCTYECRICPIEDLIAALPDEVTVDNAEDVRARLDGILALYAELTEEEQGQIDLSRCMELQEALDAANAPVPAADGDVWTDITGSNLQWKLENGTLTIKGEGIMPNWKSLSPSPWSGSNPNIIRVVVESGVTSIGNFAFYDCKNLAQASLPDSVTSIGSSAFSECENLALTSLPDNVISIEDFAFSKCKNLALTSLPDSVTSIGDFAFSYCENLALTSLPGSVTSIGNNAFEYCSGLRELTLPDNLKTIENEAFAYCFYLRGLTLPADLETIGNEAFLNCDRLSEITIPEKVRSIGQRAFSSCVSLSRITFKGKTTPNLGEYAFIGTSHDLQIIVPKGAAGYWEGGWPKDQMMMDGAAAKLDGIDTTAPYVVNLADAFTEANSGATVTLLTDVDLGGESIDILSGCTYTLDLNSHTVSSTGPQTFYIMGGGVTIKDSGEGGAVQGASEAISINGGTLSIESGTVFGFYGVNVSGGTVNISGEAVISGEQYGLHVEGNGKAVLSGGTFSGIHAISVNNSASVTLKDLLANGYAYHQNDAPVKPVGLTGTVTVKNCGHNGEDIREYSHAEGTTVHSGTCLACGTKLNEEPCNYVDGMCACGSKLEVMLPDGLNLTYDGTAQEPGVAVTVDGQELAADKYTARYENNIDAGDAAVTVSSTNFSGEVQKTFSIGKAALTADGTGTASGTYGTALGNLVISGLTAKWNNQTMTGTWAFTDSDQVLDAGNHTCPATFTPQTGKDNYEPLTTDIAVTIHKASGPAAPAVTGSYKVSTTDKTKFVYAVDIIQGAEYSRDNAAWQDSPVFDGIEPDSKITFYARLKETNNVETGAAGNTGEVTFNKLPNNEKPPLSFSLEGENNNRTITITTVDGAEYSFDGGAAYGPSNVKTGCSGVVTVAIRYGETVTQYASQPTKEEVDTNKQQQTNFAISPVASKIYGDAAFTLSTTGGNGSGGVTFETSNPNALTISGTTATIQKAGTVTITARKAADNNYNEAVATLTLAIGKRPITVTADSFTVLKGAAMPTLTYKITSGSLAGTDSFTTDPTLSTAATDTNTPGEFAITISGGVLANGDSYQITYAGGKLIVTEKIPVQLALTANPDSLFGGGDVTLTLTGLPDGGEATVSCSDSSITVTRSGENWKASLPDKTAKYTFTANYSGDAQHTSAEATCTVSVTRHTSGDNDGNIDDENTNDDSDDNAGGENTGSDSDSSSVDENAGGNSDSGSTTIDRPDEKYPNNPIIGETIPVKPDKDGNVNIDGSFIEEAINKAISDANKNNLEDKGLIITVPVNHAADAESLAVTIPAETLDQLIDAKVQGFDITTDGLPCISLTPDTLEMLVSQSQGGNLRLRLTKITVTSEQAKEAVGARPVYDFSFAFIKDGKETPITDWKGQTVSVRLPYTPAKDEQVGNIYAVYVNADGNIEWLTKSSYDADQKALIFEAGHFSVYGVGYKNPAPVFTDIAGHWAADNIIFAAGRGLLAGTGNNQFSPDTGLTREMFATALGRLAGIDPENYKTEKFTDVKADACYAPYVNWAAENGIVNGTSPTAFSPDADITREQMAVILADYAKKMGYDLPAAHEAVTFADDAQIGSQAAKAVRAMQQAGIMAGKDDGRFDPKGTATRAEAATVLRRFIEIVIDPQAAQGWMQDHGGSWLYMKDGKAVMGWLDDDKKWYWLDKNSLMFADGWKEINGKWYYFYSDGAMAANTVIDGREIGPDGAEK